MTDFSRKFPIDCLTDPVLKENSWFTDLLSRWQPAGDAVNILLGGAEGVLARDHVSKMGEYQHLRVAFRNGYMNFYCGGQSIAKVEFVRDELRATIHEKYVYGPKNTSGRYVKLTSKGFPEHSTGRLVPYESLQKWISNLNSKIGREKRFVDLVVAHNHDVIDLEMGLPAYSQGSSAPRIDLLALEHCEGSWQIVSWEAKLVGDGRLRCSGNELPEVVTQLKHYTDWLNDSARARSVAEAYQENCRLLVELHKIARRRRPEVEELGAGILAVAASNAPPPLVDIKPRPMVIYDKKDETFTGNGHFDKLKHAGLRVKIAKSLSDLALSPCCYRTSKKHKHS
jgi:hypothetical protein